MSGGDGEKQIFNPGGEPEESVSPEINDLDARDVAGSHPDMPCFVVHSLGLVELGTKDSGSN